MTNYSSVPSDTAPYLELLRTSSPGEPGTPVSIYPKLPARPSKVKFSPDRETMVLVNSLRREELAGIGSASEVTPDGGLRIFNNTDRFLFLGGDAVVGPALYERTGPVYQNTDLLPVPVSGYALHAAFSQGGLWLFVVWSTDANVVQVYKWNGADAGDTEGSFDADSTIDVGAAVTGLMITPLNTYVVINRASACTVLTLDGAPALSSIAPTPAGRIVAVSADETEWVSWGTGGLAKVYDFAAEAWTERQELAGTATAGTEAAYSPDGAALVLAGTGAEYPKSYAKIGADWQLVYSEVHGGSVGFTDIVFRGDGEQMAATHGAATEFYDKTLTYPSPLTEDVNDVSGSLATTIQANVEGSVVAYVTTAGTIQYARDAGTGIDTKTTIGGNYRDVAVSDIDGLGDFFVFATTTTNTGALYRINGAGTVTPIAVPALTGSTYKVSMSADAGYLSVVCDTGVDLVIRVFSRDLLTGTVSFMQDIAVPGEGSINQTRRRALFSPDGTMIAMNAKGTFESKMYVLDGGVWVAAPALPWPAIRKNTMIGPVWSSDSQTLYAVGRSTEGSGSNYLMGFARQPDDSFLLDFDPGVFWDGTGAPYELATAPGNAGVAVSIGTTDPTNLYVWIADDLGDLVQVDTPGVHDAILDSGVAWTAASIILTRSTAPGNYTWLWTGLVPNDAYVLAETFASALPPTFWGYGPGNLLAHFGTEAQPHHVLTADMVTEAADLSFAPDWTAAQVFEVLFSQSQKAVVFNTPDGIEVATRNGAGPDFLNSKDVTGVFVTLYDLEGDKFKERGYAIHAIDTVLRDLSFSATAQVFSYHASLPPGAPIDAPRGRLIYDVTTAVSPRFEFRGQVYDADVTRSFIAYSPFETHFAVTLERDTTLHSIVLAEFSADFNFTEQNEQPVEFGPPAFSHCDDVVVAHGGAIPFTFFKHDDVLDVLTLEPITITDWTSTSVILDIMFNDTCDGIIVLTEDELIPMEKDEDSADTGEAAPLDEPIDEEDFDDAAVEEDDDDPENAVVVTTTTPGGGGGGGTYTSGPIVSSLNYVPYCVVTVSFRVNPVPI